MVLASPIPGFKSGSGAGGAEDSDNAVETDLATPANGEDHQVIILISLILSWDSGKLLKMRSQFQHHE